MCFHFLDSESKNDLWTDQGLEEDEKKVCACLGQQTNLLHLESIQLQNYQQSLANIQSKEIIPTSWSWAMYHLISRTSLIYVERKNQGVATSISEKNTCTVVIYAYHYSHLYLAAKLVAYLYQS
jgi:hypothetical protein